MFLSAVVKKITAKMILRVTKTDSILEISSHSPTFADLKAKEAAF